MKEQPFEKITPCCPFCGAGLPNGFTSQPLEFIEREVKARTEGVLNYLLTRNHPDYEGEKIIMSDGSFYWDSDKDGDMELDEKDIIKLYENNTRQLTPPLQP